MKLLERVRKAYRKTKRKPCQRSWNKHDIGECCPMAAIAIEVNPSLATSSSQNEFVSTVTKRLRRSTDWVYGFLCGFDDDINDEIKNRAFTAGYQAGRQVAKSLLRSRRAS